MAKWSELPKSVPIMKTRPNRARSFKVPVCLVAVVAAAYISGNLVSSKASASPAEAGQEASGEALLRDARERFNRAIEAQDVEAITSFFAPEYHIVTGRSDQAHGIENEAIQIRQMFAADPGFVCTRATREVRVNAAWGLAEELGDWRCEYTVDEEKNRSSGVYAAKWQRPTRGTWLLQSEVFTTLQCQGGAKGCRPPDPID